jgi:nicotinate-nucleotide pyrophosphorylase [carboxylating] (EC 2.4.2.19)
MEVHDFLLFALNEDIRDGDHSTLACIPEDAVGTAILKIKENGIIAGIDIAEMIIRLVEPDAIFTRHKEDGDHVLKGESAFEIKARVHTILKAERLILNIMQRMSGIATLTSVYVKAISQYPVTLLDTRKTTPNFRWFEKRAVVLGGAQNHRMGLYDMIMLKDNHIDFAGGIEKAIEQVEQYQLKHGLTLPVEVEARTLSDVKRIVDYGKITRIMFDNFTPSEIVEGLNIVQKKYETEASGGITLENIRDYAATGR